MSELAFPLQWPVGWKREHCATNAPFKPHSIDEATREVAGELRLLYGQHPVISSNLVLRKDGYPHSGQPQPRDAGVAVYFSLRQKRVVLACDRWRRVEHNIWAIARHIEALRGQKRWGVGSVEQAFAGYAALCERTEKDCWEILGFPPGTTIPSGDAGEALILERYRDQAKKAHPDAGGSDDAFKELGRAKDIALATIKPR